MTGNTYADLESEFLEDMAIRFGFTGIRRLIFRARFGLAAADLSTRELADRLAEDPEIVRKEYKDWTHTVGDHVRAICRGIGAEMGDRRVQWAECLRWLKEDRFPLWLESRGEGMIAASLDWVWGQVWALAQPDPGFGVRQVLVDGDRLSMVDPKYKRQPLQLGDRVRLNLSLPQQGFLTVLERGTSREVFCLSPSVYAPDPQVIAGSHSLPMTRSKHRMFTLNGMPGREELVAVLLAEDPDLPWMRSEQWGRMVHQLDVQDLMGVLKVIQQGLAIWLVRLDYLVA